MTRHADVSGPGRTSEETADQLADLIRQYRASYYRGTPEVSDAEFDALEDRLRGLEPAHPVLAEVGTAFGAAAPAVARPEHGFSAPVRARAESLEATCAGWFGDKLGIGEAAYEAAYKNLFTEAPDHPVFARIVPPSGFEWPKAQHELPMGSLNKANTAAELSEWAEACDKRAAELEHLPVSGALAVTEKLDGLSVELVYDAGQLEAAITRGDGEIGERITANVSRMRGVPSRIDRPGRLSVRGEIVLGKSHADAVLKRKAEIDKNFSGVLTLRNTAAGLARMKEPRLLVLASRLEVLSYDVEGVDGLETERDKWRFLTELGFQCPPLWCGDLAGAIALHAEYEAGRRLTLDYEIDGLVVRADRLDTFTLLGELNRRPRAAIAFKFASEMKVSELLEIRWETGDSGRVTPVAIVAPVQLVGAKIERASLHNWARVHALAIGVGDQVLISRRNDVIPYVEKVELKGERTETRPTQCGRCQGPLSEDGEYLVCKNADCPARQIGRLKIWIRQLDLAEWGEKTLVRLFEEGLVREPADLYTLTAQHLTRLDGFGEVSAKKLLDPLAAKKEIPVATFIAALGIETVSLETAKLLVQNGLDSLEAIAAASVEQLAALHGLGAIKAERILEGVRSRLAEAVRLRAVGVVPLTFREGGPLAGLSFCFSGSHSRPRKQLQNLVERGGGKVASSVTRGVTYLVLADKSSASAKAEKARKNGTEILDETEFEALLGERGVAVE